MTVTGSITPPLGRDFVAEYAARAPLALALERSLECTLYLGRRLERPVLDVGCGDGCFIEVLLGGSALVEHGLDSDARELRHAQRRRVYVDLLHADARRIPLPTGSVATVISNSTLEHIRELDAVLGEIRRVLRPGGHLYATVPTDRFDRYAAGYRLLITLRWHGAAERYRKLYNAFWRHMHYESPSAWRDLLERSGFDVQEVREFCPPKRCTLHDLLVPLALPAFVMKKMIGRYFLLPAVRRELVRRFRAALPATGTGTVQANTGGLVFLVARRPVKL